MAAYIIDMPEYFISNWAYTLFVSLAASSLALLLSLLFSLLALRYSIVDKIFAPLVALSQSFPLQAIAPIFIIALGTGFHSKVVVALLIAIFPLYAGTSNALQNIPPTLQVFLIVTRATFWRGALVVRLPVALPAIVSATKVGFTLAVLGAVVAEFIQPDRGLGKVILVAQSNFNTDIIYICIIILMGQGLIVFSSLSILESKLFRDRHMGR
jgi:NitT/TauT family transport system permease protein